LTSRNKKMVKKTELKTNFPQESGDYKIVQLEMDDVQYLWTIVRGGHARCLTYLLEEEGNRFGLYAEHENRPYKAWQGRFAKQEEQADMLTYETIDDLAAQHLEFWNEHIPTLRGDGYQVLGMGKVRIDPDDKTATFYGISKSYGIGIGAEQLSLLRNLKPDWKIKQGD